MNDTLSTAISPDPASISKQDLYRCYEFTHSKCFKYTKIGLIAIYALTIVAWGGMLFLILVGAANKTMPNKETRDNWIEIDSQILNALFCLTGIGLLPWRMRDLYHLYSKKNRHKLLHHHSYTTDIKWIRIVVWTFIANSLFQIGMAVCMWSMDMYKRPAWLVGVFVGLGCITGAAAGLIQFKLRMKTIEKKKRNESVLKY